MCSDTISNLDLEIGTEHGEAREREKDGMKKMIKVCYLAQST